MKKRLLAMLLAVVMVCSLLPVSALAADYTYSVTVGGTTDISNRDMSNADSGSWTTSDEAVATVSTSSSDSGGTTVTITGVSTGTATITHTYTTGGSRPEEQEQSHTDTYTVTVTDSSSSSSSYYGWSVATITPNTDSSGYSLDTASGTVNDADNVTVEGRNDDESTWTELTADSDNYTYQYIRITPNMGYYVECLVVACNDSDGYGCQSVGNGSAYTASFDATTGSITLDTSTSGFYHGGRGAPYHVFIQLAVMPNPVVIEYEAGDEVASVSNSSNLIVNVDSDDVYATNDNGSVAFWYTTAGPTHTVLAPNVSTTTDDEGKTIYYVQVGDEYWQFDGWEVTYYSTASSTETTSYPTSSDDLTDTYGTPDAAIEESLTLFTYVKLVAQWTKMDTTPVTYNVTYSWSGLPTDEATLYDSEGNTTTPSLPSSVTGLVNGQFYTVDTTYTSSTVVYTHDAYGNVNGKYTFSGWSDPGNGTISGSNVEIIGSWTYTDVEVGTYTITVNYYIEGTTTQLKDSYSENAQHNATYDVTSEIDEALDYNGDHYVKTSVVGSATGTATGDGIPDKYQVLVKFESAYEATGTVTGTGTTQVYTLIDSNGDYVENGSVTPTLTGVETNPATNYAFDIWTKDEDTETAVNPTATLSVTGGDTITFYAHFATDEIDEDGGSDGTPDKYQATVTYKVVNGTWSDGTTEDQTAVFTLKTRDETTTLWETVSPTPTLDNTIPTGMTANTNYEQNSGSWSSDISSATEVTGDATYTYTFNTPNTYTITVNYYIEGTTTQLKDSYSESAQHNATYDVTNEIYETLDSNGDHYVQTTVSGLATGTATGNVVVDVYYALDNWKDDPDGDSETGGGNIPDKYQVLVEYVAGTGGSVSPTFEVLTIYANDQPSETGDVTASGSTATATSGYDFKNWANTTTGTVTGTASLTETSPATGDIEITGATGGEVYTFTAYFEEESTEPAENPSLNVTKTAKINGKIVTTAEAGETITYTITVTNDGDILLEDITVTDVFSAKGSIKNVKATSNVEIIANGNYFIDELEVGEDAIITYTYTVKSTDTTIKNVATATIGDKTYDTDKVVIDVEDGDDDGGDNDGVALSITKTVSGTGANEDDKFELEIYVEGTANKTYSCTYKVDSTTKTKYVTFDKNCEATLTIEAGATIKINGLDYGAKYSVEEVDPGEYTVTYSNESGRLKSSTTKVSINNYLSATANLNTEDHYSYIIGYTDGTVQPEGNLTRAEAATIFFRLLTDDARETYWSQTNPYSDVSSDDWCNNAISTLYNMGIISGYTDGTFQPNEPITRAELTKIAVSFFTYAGSYSYHGEYTDIDGTEWHADFVAAATELGMINGYTDGTFQPENYITRAETCAIVNRTLGRNPDADHLLAKSVMNTWPDNSTTAWYYADIQEATNSHDYEWIVDDGETVEDWTAKLEDRDWAALEKSWSTAYSAPGGEVMG